MFERDADLVDYLNEPGVEMDAKVSEELLVSLFLPDSENKLHDGAVIIKNLRIAQAGAVLPLSANARLDKALGTRHRAAIGVTEETDAVVVVVSEERGSISLCFGGNIARDLDAPTLRKALLGLFQKQKRRTQTAEVAGARGAGGAGGAAVREAAAARGARLGADRSPSRGRRRRRGRATPSATPPPTAKPRGVVVMARPLLVRIFVDELPLKVLSMVLAVTLFVLVRNDKDATSGAYVKVIYTLPEDRVLVSDPVAEVKVAVRGPWTKLQHLDRSLEPIRIDLTRVHTPDVRIDEDTIKLPAGRARVVDRPVRGARRVRAARDARACRCSRSSRGSRPTAIASPRSSPSRRTCASTAPRAPSTRIERVPTRPLRITDARGPVRGDVALEAPPAHTRFLEATDGVGARRRPAGDGRAHLRGSADQGASA